MLRNWMKLEILNFLWIKEYIDWREKFGCVSWGWDGLIIGCKFLNVE